MSTRNHAIMVRISADEKDALDSQKKREHFSSLSEWIRHVLLSRAEQGKENEYQKS